ncbi:hypothetical protein swp_0665 [Shewanella piezotolerans WP3]|uniref:Uncharacterized protein n=1 Tax=Shewanella piezotolerans (strain WP3 / JCM 13877) TaxID=225849 RepID=B8CIK7_SHEPW|nr:hypothetical protein swp_0665 [Shewanella piezotolerans WP3]
MLNSFIFLNQLMTNSLPMTNDLRQELSATAM